MRSASLLLVAASLVSCGPDSTSAPPASIVPSGYQFNFVEVRGCRQTVEHTATTPQPVVDHIRVMINPGSAEAYRMNAARLPANTVVVKEEFSDPSCSSGSLRAWTVMRKEPAGYDPAHNDWHWQRVRASDRAVLVDGRVASCIDCHRTQQMGACVLRDWQCTLAP